MNLIRKKNDGFCGRQEHKGVVVAVMVFCMISLWSHADAKNFTDVRPIEELSGLESAQNVLNVASPISLVIKAWEALENNDLEMVLELTDDCVKRFGKRARQMQDDLKGYATGSEATIRSYWALNDVATALFIQGKALQDAGRYDEAKGAYEQLVNKYSFGQCWDPNGWFWKPAEVAKENLEMIDNGIFLDFGDYTSTTLIQKAWKALEEGNVILAKGYADKCIELYSQRASEMQAGLKDYPEGDNDTVFGYWALNDVATAHFIKAKAYMVDGRNEDVIREFKIIRNELSFGQCWDPRGWWWKPVNEANNWLKILQKENNGSS